MNMYRLRTESYVGFYISNDFNKALEHFKLTIPRYTSPDIEVKWFSNKKRFKTSLLSLNQVGIICDRTLTGCNRIIENHQKPICLLFYPPIILNEELSDNTTVPKS